MDVTANKVRTDARKAIAIGSFFTGDMQTLQAKGMSLTVLIRSHLSNKSDFIHHKSNRSDKG